MLAFRNLYRMESTTIFSLVIIGTLIKTGYSQFFDSKFNICGGLSDQRYSFFGGVDPNLKYMLYTRFNPQDACELQPTKKALRACKFDSNSRTAVIVHGFIPLLKPESPVFDVKDKLLEVDNYNVVVFNWTAYSDTKNLTKESIVSYEIAAMRSFYVGLKLASWIHFLQVYGGADTNNFHLISHSLGAEVCHFAAKTICNLGQITYLDAAAPLFRDLPEFLQPSNSDAYFVESIHTNGALNVEQGLGFLKPIADIDYYPNGGQMQPQCVDGTKYLAETGKTFTVDSHVDKISCSHDSSYSYYISSFNRTCKFLGRICDNYEDFVGGKCSSAPACRMGFYSKRLPGLPAHSKCFLKTSTKPPYCLN